MNAHTPLPTDWDARNRARFVRDTADLEALHGLIGEHLAERYERTPAGWAKPYEHEVPAVVAMAVFLEVDAEATRFSDVIAEAEEAADRRAVRASIDQRLEDRANRPVVL